MSFAEANTANKKNTKREKALIESDTSRDSEELNVLASTAGATEFELFGLAFYDCHGYQAEEIVLQELFIDFLHTGQAPQWLKSFVKRRISSSAIAIDSIRKSAYITTGASSAIVKWRPSVELFSFTLIGAAASSEYHSVSDSKES